MKKLGRKLTVLLTLATLLLTLCVTASAAGSLSVRLWSYNGGQTTSYGASLSVFKNGELIQTVTLDGVRDYTWECPDFDDTAIYSVFWNKGTKDNTLRSQIDHNGTTVYLTSSTSSMNSVVDGGLLYTNCTDHNYVDGVCSECSTPCLHGVTVRTAQDVCGDCGVQQAAAEIAFGTSESDLTLGRGSLLDAADYMYKNNGSYYAKLLGDVTLDEYADFGAAAVTLDLAGFDITSTENSGYGAIYVRNNGHLIIDDSAGGGSITALKQTAVTGSTTAGGVCYITLKDGAIVGASRGIDGSVVTIEGGSVSAPDAAVVAGAAITVEGGTVAGEGRILWGAAVTVTGGTIAAGSHTFCPGSPAGLDLSAYTGELIGKTVYCSSAGDALAVRLPAGLGLYDGSTVVTQLKSYKDYTIGECTLPVLRFEANGGSGTMYSAYVTEGYTLPACTFTGPNGSLFLSWEIGGTSYAPGDSFTTAADATAKAVWEIAYAVSFDANGGSGEMAGTGVVDGGSYTLPACTFTYDHKLFDCWEVNGERKAVGENITVTANTVVKALWLDTYTVTYHINLEGKSDTHVVEDVLGDYTLEGNLFDKPFGKSFAGWMTKADGTAAEYSGGNTLSVTSPLDLYAFYADDVAYYGADADNLTASGSLADAFAAAASSSVGYVRLVKSASVGRIGAGTFTLDFAGHTLIDLNVTGNWMSTLTLTDTSTDGSGGVTGTLDLERGKNADGSRISGSKIIIEGGNYGAVNAGNDSEVSVTGGSFAKTFNVLNGASVTVTGGEFRSQTTLLANNGGSLTVTGGDFYLDGASHLLRSYGAYDDEFNSLGRADYHGLPSDAEVVHTQDARLRIPAAWEGFRIERGVMPYSTQWLHLPDGWHVFDPLGTAAYEVYDMYSGLHTVYSSKNSIISFDANGGSGTMESIERRVAVEGAVPSYCDFTPPKGHKFLGWATSSDGSPVERFTPRSRTVTLYAIWKVAEAEWIDTSGKAVDGSFSEAVAALNAGQNRDGSINLVSDVEMKERLEFLRDCFIEMDGCDLTNAAGFVGGLVVGADSKLTLRNGTVSGGNFISVVGELELSAVEVLLPAWANYTVRLDGSPKLTLEDTTFVPSSSNGVHFRFETTAEMIDTTLCGDAHGARFSFAYVGNNTVRFADGWWFYTLQGEKAEELEADVTYVLCDGHTGDGVSHTGGASAETHTAHCPCGHSFEQAHVDEDGDVLCDLCGEQLSPEALGVTVSDGGLSVSADSPVKTVILAAYGEDGQMLSSRFVSAGESLTVENFFDSGYVCFFLDENGVPLLPKIAVAELA